MLRVTKFSKGHIHNAQDNLQVCHGGKASMIASLIKGILRSHPDTKPVQITKTVERQFGVTLTYNTKKNQWISNGELAAVGKQPLVN